MPLLHRILSLKATRTNKRVKSHVFWELCCSEREVMGREGGIKGEKEGGRQTVKKV